MSVLYVWYLADTSKPTLIGKIELIAQGRGFSFTYDKQWIIDGFPLSGDMPLQKSPIVPLNRDMGLGAINDAMPDRWGERAIRYLDNPKEFTELDMLYLAGDRRFGALGFSKNKEVYQPHDRGPLPEINSLELLQDLIFRIENHESLSEQEKLIISSTKTMGGAHPKALVRDKTKEYISKFPRGTNVDIGLIEHASMTLASKAGIVVSSTLVKPTLAGHVVLIERFDRKDEHKRMHCLSAKTVLTCGVVPSVYPISELSYPAMADFIRQFASPDKQLELRQEIFRRMAFNICIANTDDHEKNHAFIWDGKYWSTSPAFDVLPLTSTVYCQEMIVGDKGKESTRENALSQCIRFGFERDSAIEQWFKVADQVSQWKSIFSKEGVSSHDIDYLSNFIESEDKILMRDRDSLSLDIMSIGTKTSVLQSLSAAQKIAANNNDYSIIDISEKRTINAKVKAVTPHHAVLSLGRSAAIIALSSLNKIPIKGNEVEIVIKEGKGILTHTKQKCLIKGPHGK